MRRILTTGAELYRRNPKGRLGSALVKAEDIASGSRLMQIIVIKDGRARLLDIRVCGRTGMTATDVSTGVTERIPVKAVWACARAARA